MSAQKTGNRPGRNASGSCGARWKTGCPVDRNSDASHGSACGVQAPSERTPDALPWLASEFRKRVRGPGAEREDHLPGFDSFPPGRDDPGDPRGQTSWRWSLEQPAKRNSLPDLDAEVPRLLDEAGDHPSALDEAALEIGRASCRERVQISV